LSFWIVACIFAFAFVFSGVPVAAQNALTSRRANTSAPAKKPVGPEIKGASAVLMDAVSGQVLYARNPHTRRPNASTTKIMTSILLMENCYLTDYACVAPDVCNTPFTSIHLKAHEQISVQDLLYGMLLRSANDAAVAVAEHISGRVDKFAELMNWKAKLLGCADTHFVTPNGLYDPKHYSSAYDLCLMARYAMQYPLFEQVVSTRKYTLNSRTINRQDLLIFNKSKFLKDYPGADGVKSGYIKQAGYCYVGSATRNGWRLISAVLKSDNASRDTEALMDYGFAHFKPVKAVLASQTIEGPEVVGGARRTVLVRTSMDVQVVIPKTGAKVSTKLVAQPVKAPVTAGSKVGTMIAMVNGRAVASVDAIAAEDVGTGTASLVLKLVMAGALLAAVIMIGGIYGTTASKGPGRGGRGVSPTVRSPDYRR